MDILTYAALNKKVEEAKNVFDEKISESVNAYLDKNPPTTGATAEQAAQINKNVADIDELKGEKVDKTGITLGQHTDGLIYIFVDGNPVGVGLSISGEVVVPTLYNLPVLRLTGDTTGMTKEQEVVMTGEFVDVHGEPLFDNKVIRVKWQGSSSIWYDKKNYSIKMFESDGETKFNYKAFDDVDANNGYHLKANFIDAWHCRNIVTVNLAKDLYKKPLPSNARGCIDGFPIIVEINGEKQGIYTWNLKQHKSVYGLDENNPNHLMYRANTNGTDTCNFRALSTNNMADSTTDWEDRFPETNTAENRAKLNRLISFVMDSDDATFKSDFSQYLDLDYTIDYWILCYFGGFTDSVAKNMNIVTYDGNIWYPTFYDCDTTWGINWNGSEQTPYNVQCPSEYQAPNNLLWERLVANFPQEIYNRYYELRDTYLNADEVIRRMQEFIDSIPEEEYEYDRSKWTLPTASVNSGIDYMTAWIKNRATYVDGKMNELVDTTVPLESISIVSTLKVTSGETAQLEVTYTPTNATNKNVTWGSSNGEIATVDETGLVTAVSDGNCVITCTSEDGGFTAQCGLTVNAPSVATDGLVYDINFRNTMPDSNGKFYSSVNEIYGKVGRASFNEPNVSEKGFLLKVGDNLEIPAINNFVDIDNEGLTLEVTYYNNTTSEVFRIGNNTKLEFARGGGLSVNLIRYDANGTQIKDYKNPNVINKESVVVPWQEVVEGDGLIHIVWRFYPTGNHEIFINNCKASYTVDISTHDHFETNLMNNMIRERNPYNENAIIASYRAYNRPLTAAEIANNFYVEKTK